MDLLGESDVVLHKTDTLTVWIQRPTSLHSSWWLCFYSTAQPEVRAWNRTISEICKARNFMPFHQKVHPTPVHTKQHPDCEHWLQPANCPGVIQGWEMLMGCSEWGLRFHEDSLEEIVRVGRDHQLERLLAAIPDIQQEAERLTKLFTY